MGTENSPENSGSSTPAPTPRAAREQTPPRERVCSRSPRQGYGLRSRFVEHTEHHHAVRGRRRWRASPPHRDQVPRDEAAPGPSKGSSQLAPAPRAAREQTPPRERVRSRSPRQGCGLRSRFVETTDCDLSAGRRRRQRVSSETQVRQPFRAAQW